MSFPQLRFKGDDGQNFPEWEDTTLGELCSITTGKLDANAMIGNGEYRFYTCAKEYYRIDNYAFDTDALLVSGNGANVGYIHHYKGKFNAYQRTYVLDRFDENIIFIKYFLDGFLHIRIFKEAKEGNTPYIVMGTLTEMSIRLPKLAEQTKIANFLTSVDEKITQLTQKCELLTQYKKGVMQQIFSQELRFKDDDGQNFPEWEETTLGNIATFLRGGSLSKSDISPDGKFECVHYGELFTIYSEVIRSLKSKTNLTEAIKSEFGDILMPSSDVTPAGLAKASCILKAGIILGGDINIIRLKNKTEPIFISYLLNFYKHKIIELVSGTTVKHIYIKDIKTISMTVPHAIKEQTKIANFLAAIDDKITVTQTQLKVVKQYKQGLLQQMFV